MKMELKNIEINRIVIKQRIREDMGDIDALANSIRELGLLTPVLINSKHLLISGFRRLEACKKLGQSHIQAILVDVEDENLLFQIESQENLCRKSLTTSEIDKEIEMKKRFAMAKIRGKTFLGNIWNKIKNIFSKKGTC
jgi:ParB family chromosome partitioning protein